ncbi:hypothetical protein D3273_25300 [Lichenibacterium minor]|uniref:Uncharacterized protein n=1 Tax=Lichenibacterium minor TaxID=2316528 RepID=A0A4V1RTX6_9HYPH|nr:hypothetical protein [Lichenibacterium minor]RYC29184.1 hypothetical protein D3273_25300 [Lichenibacterium minor]
MDENPSDLPGKVTWFKRVTPSMVEAFQIAGWAVEPVASSHHDAHCVLMRFTGKGDPENAPRMPVGRPRVVRKSYPVPSRRWGGPGRW